MQHGAGGGFFGVGGDGGGPSALRPQIFIGRVPPNLPVAALEARLHPFGATNVRMLDSKGCAFADFGSYAEAESAIQALNGLHLGGALEGLNVRLAEPKSGPRGAAPVPKVFIGNLGSLPAGAEDYVTQVCRQFGEVLQTRIFTKTPSSPPCAFVTFGSFVEAELCIGALHGVEHELAAPGRTLNAKLAALGGMGQGHSAQRAMGGPGAMGAGQVAMVAPPPGHSVQNLPVALAASQLVSALPKVFIGGLPDTITEEFILGMMAPFGDIQDAKLHKKQGARTCGFVRFMAPGDAERAVSALADLGRFTINIAYEQKGGKRLLDQPY